MFAIFHVNNSSLLRHDKRKFLKSKSLCLVLIFCSLSQIIYSKESLKFTELCTVSRQHIKMSNAQYGLMAEHLFGIVDKLIMQKESMATIKNHCDIRMFFALPLPEQTGSDIDLCESINVAQQLMLCKIYDYFFDTYITDVENLMELIFQASEYWKQELFYCLLPWSSQSPEYWFYTARYKKELQQRINILKKEEDKILNFLGMALHGRRSIKKIDSISEICHTCRFAVMPLYKFYNTAYYQAATLDPLKELDQTTIFFKSIESAAEEARQLLQVCKKPNHVARHKITYAFAASVCVAACIACKVYENEIPGYLQKFQSACENFKQHYVVDPAIGIKETLWDNKTAEFKHFGPLVPLSHVTFDKEIKLPPPSVKLSDWEPESIIPAPQSITSALMLLKQEDRENIDKVLNGLLQKLIDKINGEPSAKLDRLVLDATQALNMKLDEVVQALNIKIDEYNKKQGELEKIAHYGITFFNDNFMKNQQVNLYLAAIGPTLFATYGIYHSGNSLYNRYVKHNSWYKPMRNIVRLIDQILNISLGEDKPSFAIDGMLHMLIVRLKSYMYCLPQEELMLFTDDLDELLSFDLNYDQKRNLLNRMRTTYEFLR